MVRPLRFLTIVVVVLCLTIGCKRKGDAVADPAVEPPVVSDSAEGLQFTWIDDKGGFHTELRASEVPAAARDVVRVRTLDPAHDLPDVDRVFVVDLRVASADGNYAVRAVPRAEFEDVAVKRRATTGSAVLVPKAAGPAASGSAAGPGDVAERPAVIIYGASWCGPCHQAAAHLKKRGVPFVEHDIEQDSSAAREMQSKLAKAGVRGGSIPVLDVRGRILVGFDARAVDQALGSSL